MKNRTPIISIIMPIYNGSKWLDESIQSVLNQTYVHFELILINDESTDNSLSIIQKYAKIDSRIRVYSNKNQGPGQSLNFGITKAKGEYLCFIDQDDYYLSDYLEKMLLSIQEYQTDFVVCYGRYFNDDRTLNIPIKYRFFNEGYHSLTTLDNKKDLFWQFTPQWTKIVKKDFITKNHIHFPNRHNKVHDVPFHLLIIWFGKSFSVVNEQLYFHRLHDKQITHNIDADFATGFIESFKDLEAYFYQYIPKQKEFIRFAANLFIKKATKRQKIYMYLKSLQYCFKEKIKRIFYHQKIKNNKQITRILFFKFKKKIKSKTILTVPKPNVINCGKHSYCAGPMQVANPSETVIGNFVSIGTRVQLGCGEHPLEFLSTSPYFYFDNLGFKNADMPSYNSYWEYEPVVIGNDVWIGDDVFIKNGVKIGSGAVIGAKSVVTKDVLPYTIVAGVPAKIIKYRFDEQTIQILLDLKWWNLPDSIIKQIPYDDIEKAIEFVKKHKK